MLQNNLDRLNDLENQRKAIVKTKYLENTCSIYYEDNKGNQTKSDKMRTEFSDVIREIRGIDVSKLTNEEIDIYLELTKMISMYDIHWGLYDSSTKVSFDEESKVLNFYIDSDVINSIIKNLDKIHINSTDENLIKDYDDKIYQIQKNFMEKFIIKDDGKTKYRGLDRSTCLSYLKKAGSRNDIAQFLELAKNPITFIDDGIGFGAVKLLLNDKNVCSDLKRIIRKGRSAFKKNIFLQKISDAVEFIKDHIVAISLIGTASLSFLGISHHLWHAVSHDLAEANDKVEIEQNIEATAGFSKYTCSAIVATQKDGKYYVEIFGTGIKNNGDTPEFCSATYEVDKELYDTIYKYYDIEYEYGKDGQIVGATNSMRTNLDMTGGATARRAEWKTMEELVEVTKSNPVSVTWHSAQNEIEKDM